MADFPFNYSHFDFLSRKLSTESGTEFVRHGLEIGCTILHNHSRTLVSWYHVSHLFPAKKMLSAFLDDSSNQWTAQLLLEEHLISIYNSHVFLAIPFTSTHRRKQSIGSFSSICYWTANMFSRPNRCSGTMCCSSYVPIYDTISIIKQEYIMPLSMATSALHIPF